MSDELTLSMRPRTFSEMIGSKSLLRQIRKIIDSGHVPKSWMFSGETGCGKTTTARIMAVSFQCRHSKDFGSPCSRCYRHRKSFDITTLNVKQRKVEDLENAISGASYAPKPGSRRRIYILDEAHMLTDHSQNLLLEQLEDCPRSTNWIICTTKPDAIIATIQSRCTMFAFKKFELEEVKELVKRGLKKCHSDRSR